MAHAPKIYTPDEANRYIPQLCELLPKLKILRDSILKERDSHDIEEVTSHGSQGDAAQRAKEVMDQHRRNIHSYEREFEKQLKFFDDVGCDLKSLDPGLVDFYANIEGQLAYLCWKEGESEIRFWHSLSGGYGGRQEL